MGGRFEWGKAKGRGVEGCVSQDLNVNLNTGYCSTNWFRTSASVSTIWMSPR